MPAPAAITGLRHRTDHINGGVPCRTPELAVDYDAEHFAFEVQRKVDGAGDGTAVSLGYALATMGAQSPTTISQLTAAGFTGIGPLNFVQDLSATLAPGTGYSYRLRPYNQAGEAGPWTAWLTGVSVTTMGVAAIDDLFDDPPVVYPDYKQAIVNRGSGGGAPFPSHRLASVQLIGAAGLTTSTGIINMGVNQDGSGGYDLAAWFTNYIDPLGEDGKAFLHILRGIWGVNQYPADSTPTAWGNLNRPGGLNADGDGQITGLLTPAEMIRRHGKTNTLYSGVPGIGAGAIGATGYLATFLDEVPARIALGYQIHVYMAGPPRDGVSDNWEATIRSPLILGIPLAAGCSVSFDTSTSIRREESAFLAGLEAVNPTWKAMEFLRSIGYQPGWEPPTRREKNPDLPLATVRPDLFHATTNNDGSGDSRYALFRRLAGGVGPTDFPGLDELTTAADGVNGMVIAWLQVGGVVPANPATPDDGLTTTLADAAAVGAYMLDLLEQDDPLIAAGVTSHLTLGTIWSALEPEDRAAILAASQQEGDTTMTAFFKDGAATQPVDNPTVVSGTIGDDAVTFPVTFKNTSGGTVNTISLTQGTYATIAFDDTPPISLNNNATANLTVTIPLDELLDAAEDTVTMNTSGGNADLNLSITVLAAIVAEARRRGVGRARRRRGGSRRG